MASWRDAQEYKWDKLIWSRPQHRVMTVDEVKLALIVLDLRERLTFLICSLCGAPAGRIFALRRNRITGTQRFHERLRIR